MANAQPSGAPGVLYTCLTCKQVYRIVNARAEKRYDCRQCKVPLTPPALPASDELTLDIPPEDTVAAPAPGRHMPVPVPAHTLKKAAPLGFEPELELAGQSKSGAGDLKRLLPPVVNGYKIIREIARGGMGAVLLADHSALRRRAAVKIILPGAADDPQAKERFLREARSMAKLKHPNIVEVYDVGTVNELPYLAMEFVEGDTFSALIQQKRLSHQDAAASLAKVARALQFAHTRGVIHRDLKPANVMLRGDGEPVIMDFGLAKELDAESAKLSATGTVLGTPAYMSPEQAQGLAIDARSDIYSLGALLYETLTRRAPFSATTAIATIYAVVHERPKPAFAVSAEAPKPLSFIAAKALEKDPARRYQTMKEFAEDLDCFLAGEPVGAAAPSPLNRIRDWCAAHKGPAAGIGVGAAALLLLLMALSFGWLKRAQNNSGAEVQSEVMSGTPETRQAHIKALAGDLHDGKLKPGSREANDALAALRTATGDTTAPDVALEAVRTLGEMKDAGSADAFLSAAAAGKPLALRVAAIGAYAGLKTPDRGNKIMAWLRDGPEVEVRIAAIDALGDLPDPSIQRELMRIIARGEPPLLAAAARRKLNQARNADTVLTIYAGGRGTTAMAGAAKALDQNKAHNDEIQAALDETNADTNATPAPKQAPPAQPFELALERLKSADRDERLQAAYDLGVLREARAEDTLRQTLADSDTDVANTAAEALGKLPPLKQAQAILDLVKSPQASTRAAAARACGLLQPPVDGAKLVEALQAEKVAPVQAELAESLGRLRFGNGAVALLDLLTHGAPTTQRKAAWALGQLGDKSACGPLFDALTRAGNDVALKDELAGALSALTGKAIGPDVEKWRVALKK